jgi:hypothetical protein
VDDDKDKKNPQAIFGKERKWGVIIFGGFIFEIVCFEASNVACILSVFVRVWQIQVVWLTNSFVNVQFFCVPGTVEHVFKILKLVNRCLVLLGMHRIPTVFAGYPAGRISG